MSHLKASHSPPSETLHLHTAVVWASIRYPLEDCIRRAKKRREDVEQRARLALRQGEIIKHITELLTARQDRDMQYFMFLSDARELPTVTSMLADNSDWQLTEERWDAMKDQIEKDMDKFAETVRAQLIKKIIPRKKADLLGYLGADAATLPDVNIDFLLLPSIFFECRCRDLFQYPSMLQHVHYGRSWKATDFTFKVCLSSLAEAVLAYIRAQGDSRDMGAIISSKFQCLRCDENVSAPVDWHQLVRGKVVIVKSCYYDLLMHTSLQISHFYSEQSWYKKVASKVHTDVVMHNDHDIYDLGSDSPWAAVLTAEEVIAQRRKVDEFKLGKPTHTSCKLCDWYRWGTTKEEVTLHIKRT